MESAPQPVDKPVPPRITEDTLLIVALFVGIFLLHGGWLAASVANLPQEPPEFAYQEWIMPSADISDPIHPAFYFAPGLLLFFVSSVVLAMRWNDRRRRPAAQKTG